MRALVGVSFVIACSLPALTSDAAVFGRNRMHLLSPRFEARLKPETRANLKRTLSVGGGTGFLVGVQGKRGLLLTNEHVMRGQYGAPVVFFRGDLKLGSTFTGRVLSQSKELDYALVEVNLSEVPRVDR